MNAKVLTRTLQISEIEKAARCNAHGFDVYPLMERFVKKPEKRYDAAVYYSWLRLYCCYEMAYTNEDVSAFVVVQTPEDRKKTRSALPLVLRPGFLFKALKCISIRTMVLTIHEQIVANRMMKGIFDPKRDAFIKMLWIDPDKRGSTTLDDILDDIFNVILKDQYDAYFETDTKKYASLYKWYGAEICAVENCKGIDHYLMRYKRKTGGE